MNTASPARAAAGAGAAVTLAGFDLARTRIGEGTPAGRARPGARAAVLLCLRDSFERLGWGEAAPLAGVSTELAAAAQAALELVAGLLRGFELRVDAAPEREVARALAPFEAALRAAPSARFALECALLDLIGEARELTVAECLGGPRGYQELAVNGLIDAADPGALALARDLAARGVSALKIKVGAAGDEAWGRQIELLGRLRATWPRPFELRLDINGGWSPDQAARRLGDLACIAPSFVEQPVAAERLVELGAQATPWAADESLALPGLAERLLVAEGCSALVLKPHVLGMLRSLDLARRAQRRGLGIVVTHLFDGPIALAAACELALALPSEPLACGLSPYDALTSKVPQLASMGRCRRARGHGLCLRDDDRC